MVDLTTFKKARIKTLMEEHGLSLLIASLPENIYYLSNYQSMSQKLLSRVDAFYVYDVGKDAGSLVIPCSEVPTALEQLEGVEIFCYGTFYFTFPKDPAFNRIKKLVNAPHDSPAHALVEAIRGTGLKEGRIGLDEARIRPKMWEQIEGLLSRHRLVPASDYFSRIRMIKHETEIAHLENAVEIAEQSLSATISDLQVGMSETEIGQLYMDHVVKKGGEPFFNVVTADLRSAFVDTINTHNRIKADSLLRFDFGCVYKGYRSDIARTAVMGEPSQKIERYYSAILEGEEQAIEAIRPGVSAEGIFETAVEGVRHGIPHYQRHHCGHGIGLEVYDPPSIAPGVKDPMEAGMVLCIETPYYELGWGGVQVEDAVLVTNQGRRYLTKSSRDLIRVSV